MKFSYSNISTYRQCPFKWKLTYIDALKIIPLTNADNALFLGVALHKGIEKNSVEKAVESYKSNYPIVTDDHLNWIIQMEYQIPKVLEILPKGGKHEIEINSGDYIGFADYLVGDTLYDFKFSNNIDAYVTSPQLSIYKYFLEKTNPKIHINHLKYIFIPKVNIRLRKKSNETIMQFRNRLLEELEKTEIKVVEVTYDEDGVMKFIEDCDALSEKTIDDDYPKNQTKLCAWCQYEKFCKSDGKEDWMILKGE